ncbi:MAG: hypothetical protein PHP06_08030 [Clostridia bacterium]|nr:hypothetical protein [Clostridia bacterium]
MLIPPVTSYQQDIKQMGTSGWGHEIYDYDQELEYVKYFRNAIQDKAKIYIWHHVNIRYKEWENIKKISSELLASQHSHLIDGITFHEAATFEYGLR